MLLMLGARLLAAASLLMLLLVLGPNPAWAAAGRVTILSNGVPRTAIVIEHRRLKQGRKPLIIVLRNSKGRASRLRRNFGSEEMSHSRGTILVYPQPLSSHWNTSLTPEGNPDAAFVHDLVAKFISKGLVDPGKVFLVGVRSAGPLAFRLACEQKISFAGVAITAAPIPAEAAENCKPARPIPLLMVSWGEGPTTSTHDNSGVRGQPALAETALKPFSEAAGCSPAVGTTSRSEKEVHGYIRAYFEKLRNCSAPVELVRLEGAGHGGLNPAGEAGQDQGDAGAEAASAKLVWDFFRSLGG